MNVLILGSGGREHALALAVARTGRVQTLYCAPGNGGTLELATNVDLDFADFEGLVAFAQAEAIDLTIVGPETPLVDGLADRFQAAGLTLFGPNAAAARMEGSKAWSKGFMRRHRIPTAPFVIVETLEAAQEHIRDRWSPNGLVIKADGLAAGKGVVVARTLTEALKTAERFIEEDHLGEAGRKLVIEDRLQGPELSLLAFLDGQTWWALPPAQDHKALLDHDAGPNTGGMGAYSPVPLATPALMATLATSIMDPIVAGLRQEGIDYRGILFVGLLVTADGPQVLEFNCRFGDPETQVLLPGLQTDLLRLMDACIGGRLGTLHPTCDSRTRLSVVAAMPGYPGPTRRGVPIHGLDMASAVNGVQILHAGTGHDSEGTLVTQGGRVLNVVAEGRDADEAASRAYAAMAPIRFGETRPVFRRDIGRRPVSAEGGR